MTPAGEPEPTTKSLTGSIRRRLGITEISRWTHDVNRQLEDLGEARDVAERRLVQAERELLVWRFRAWFDRTRPASDRLVSVVTATRNRADVLGPCIDSVVEQAHTAWELVVVDDGSDDATADVVEQRTDSRIRYVHTLAGGVCAARNVGLEHATGTHVTYLDDDNRMDPLWLAAVAWGFDRNPGAAMLYGARLIEDEEVAYGRDPGGLPMLQFSPFDRERLNAGNIVDTNVIAHRRDHPEAHFDEELSAFGDWDLVLRMTRDDEPYELPMIACAYSTSTPGRLSDGDIEAERALVRSKHSLRSG